MSGISNIKSVSNGRRILLTGGAGFIGSHCYAALVANGYTPVIFDDFSNAYPETLDRLATLCGERPLWVEGDIRDTPLLKHTIAHHKIDAVIHLAGLKSVKESATQKGRYFDINVNGTKSLIEAMRASALKRLIFSSSASVYGPGTDLPLSEDHILKPASYYGETKLQIEQMLQQQCAMDSEWCMTALRYFNPVGADASGLIGENPKLHDANLMPKISAAAENQDLQIGIFGSDYPTPDGTPIRDYIHVSDIARGHLAALQKHNRPGIKTINLGTGTGISVLQLIEMFESVTGQKIQRTFEPRREGDPARYVADPSYAKEILDWATTRNLDDMCRDQWNWQQRKNMQPLNTNGT